MVQPGEWEAGSEGIADAMKQLFDGLPDFYLFAKDLEGRFTFANRIFAEKCGLDRVEDCSAARTSTCSPATSRRNMSGTTPW